MDKRINNNGYDYVDLGLPSGTLWATCNIGASKPSDFGLYFQWSDTQGYTADQVGTGEGQKKFARDYKFGVRPNFTKYTTTGATLELEDDAAHVNMGGSWHMPTPDQINELINTANTTSTWTTQDGVNGRLFTSKKDASKSIFIPAAGYACDGSVGRVGGEADVWSSVLNAGDVGSGQYLYFLSGFVGLDSSSRFCGFSVRGVIDKKLGKPKENKSDMDRNKNLDLREKLKDVPKGLELWSYACGTCYFKGFAKYTDFPIECKTMTKNGDFETIGFTKEGKRDTIYSNGQCVLFPSKDNQDWDSFKAQKVKHFEPFQKVLHIDNNNYNKNVWKADLFSHYNKEEDRYYLASGFIGRYDEVIPYKGNEDKLGKEVE